MTGKIYASGDPIPENTNLILMPNCTMEDIHKR